MTEKDSSTLERLAKGAERTGSVLNMILGALVALVGLLAAGGSGAAFFADRAEEAAKAEARAGRPPAMVRIEAFSRSAHAGAADEVVVRGLVTPARILRNPSPYTRWIVPILATDAADPNDPPAAYLVGTDDRDPQTALGAMIQGRAEGGFLLEVNGRVVDPKLHYGAIEAAQGAFDANALTIEPFTQGRAAGLAPAEGGQTQAVVVGLIGLAVFAYGIVLFRKSRRA